ncbi:MAG: TOTE conflict system archaeo-eukaryotic primase domain-containing protein [Verrucomicrobiota bacterium]
MVAKTSIHSTGRAPAAARADTRRGSPGYLRLTDEAIEEHLRGRESIGIYPLLEDDTCWFLACDLDGKTWQLDQDFLPQRGFGNLIALPLQGRCRSADTSVFLDPATLEPWPDHWAFLSRSSGSARSDSSACSRGARR